MNIDHPLIAGALRPALLERARYLMEHNEPGLVTGIWAALREEGVGPEDIHAAVLLAVGRRDTAQLAYFYALWLREQNFLTGAKS